MFEKLLKICFQENFKKQKPLKFEWLDLLETSIHPN